MRGSECSLSGRIRGLTCAIGQNGRGTFHESKAVRELSYKPDVVFAHGLRGITRVLLNDRRWCPKEVFQVMLPVIRAAL